MSTCSFGGKALYCERKESLYFLDVANHLSLGGHLLKLSARKVSRTSNCSRRPTMLKRLVVLTAIAVGSAAVAHADSISGFFSATGVDSFTSSTLTFAPGTSVVAGAIGGTFATYLTDNNPITFVAGPIPYVQGNNIPPAIQLFSPKEAGETFGL